MTVSARIHNWQKMLFLGGGVFCAVSLLGIFGNSKAFFEAWLFAWFFWFSIAVGCKGFFMIYRLTGGLWGESLERILLAASRTFKGLFVLFLPLFFGIHSLYKWSHGDEVAKSIQLQHKHGYLNSSFWSIRALIYFSIWIAISELLTRSRFEGVRRWSAAGFIVLFISVSFASIDWIMSLEPDWYSTVYGMIILTGQGISGFAFALLVMLFFQKRLSGWQPPLQPKVLKDLGSILLTATVLWTYVFFVQWLIIWIGNEPETVTWYTARSSGGWNTIAWIVVVGQFVLPFQLLIFQKFKLNLKAMSGIALFLLFIRALDLYWMIEPAIRPEAFYFNPLLIPATLGVGGIWLALFLWRLRTIDPVSVGNVSSRRLQECLHA